MPYYVVMPWIEGAGYNNEPYVADERQKSRNARDIWCGEVLFADNAGIAIRKKTNGLYFNGHEPLFTEAQAMRHYQTNAVQGIARLACISTAATATKGKGVLVVDDHFWEVYNWNDPVVTYPVLSETALFRSPEFWPIPIVDLACNSSELEVIKRKLLSYKIDIDQGAGSNQRLAKVIETYQTSSPESP